ncbi:MAG: PLP-dependent aminotransferase family protein [Paludibacter sp.]|nr:PLP-dependent aminotransferase family protein [Paludibacter sp.]
MTRFSSSIDKLRSSEIRDLMSLANKPGMILFSGGMPDNNLFPLEAIDNIYKNLSEKEKQIAMQYGPTGGIPELLDSLKVFLKKKGLPVDENRLMITTGSLQAINILARAFIDPGDTIIVENPCFIGAISAFKSYQADIVSIPLTSTGIDLEKLKTTLDNAPQPPKFVYLTPNFHNPAGTLYSLETKQALIELLSDRDIPLIEDDAYSDLYYYEEDKKHLTTIKEINPKGIDVCYTGSFSKILGPGLRLGWMLVPDHIYRKCELIKQAIDACSPSFTQMLAHKFLESGAVYTYLDEVRVEYKKRAEAMIAALQKYLPENVSFTAPRGGFYIWLHLPENLDSTEILKRAIDKGVVFVSGKTFDPHGIINNTMRLSFCNTSAEKINKGIPLVTEAIREEMNAKI